MHGSAGRESERHLATRRTFLAMTAAAGAGLFATAALGAGGLRGSGRRTHAMYQPVEKASSPIRLLVLGGTGFLGPQIVEHAMARGHTITLFNRGRTRPHLFESLEKLEGDRDPKVGDGLKALEGDREWDAVIDTSGYVPRIVDASASLLKDRVKHYSFVSSISVYADHSKPDMNEDDPVGQLTDPTVERVDGETYGPLKAACERAAEAAMPGRVANVRPGLIVGPGDPTDRFTYWPARIAKGGEVLCPNSPDDPMQFIDARDLGAWLVHLAEQRTAGVFNAVGPFEGTTIGAVCNVCKEVSGSDATLTWVPWDFLQEQGVAPWQEMPAWVPPQGDSAGFGRRSFARAKAAGLTTRPVRDTVAATLEYWKSLPEERRSRMRAGIAAEKEATVLKAWKEKA